MGRLAGKLNTASSIVGIGTEALYNNTGTANTAVGTQALFTNTSASNNTGVGFQALRSVTTGGLNVAMGQAAGYSVTTGAENVLIGYQAGHYQNSVTTGASNTIVGAYARTSSGTVNGESVIGRYALGQGTGTFTAGQSGNGVHISTGGSTSTWSTHSDERIKKDIQDSTAGLSFLNDITPRTYKFKYRSEIPESFRIYEENSTNMASGEEDVIYHGFIAQEVKDVINNHPEVADGHNIWSESPDGVQNISTGAFVPMLVKAVQELSAKCDSLQNEINTLKGE